MFRSFSSPTHRPFIARFMVLPFLTGNSQNFEGIEGGSSPNPFKNPGSPADNPLKPGFILLTLSLALMVIFNLLIRSVAAAEIPFGPEILVGENFDGAYSVSSADLDGDGDLDLLAAAQNAGEVAWWENISGDGSLWSASNILSSTLPGAVNALPADLDGDGDQDVAGASATTGDILWWDNANGDGSVWNGSLIESFFDQTTGLFVMDMNGDGALDVAAIGSVASSESVVWYENAGDGSAWTRRTVASGLNSPAAVFSADLDRDGDADLIVGSEEGNELSWWRNNDGSGLSWTTFAISSNYSLASGIAVADMNGDGDPDVVGVFANEDTVSWRENDGSGQGWADHPIVETLSGPVAVAAMDMDGDGDEDVLGAGNSADQMVWWENVEGDASTWQEYSISSTFGGARAIRAADVNGDGLEDVVGAAENDDQVVWWRNASVHRHGYYPLDASIVVDGNMSGAFSVAAADFDRDGKQDLLAGGANSGEVAWYRNNLGNGTNWTKNGIGSLSGVRSVFVADLNGDGNPDVLAAGTSVNDIVWWTNNGNGIFGGTNSIDTNFGGAFWAAAGDVDGDGDLDVVGAAFDGGLISWWENLNGNGNFGTRNDIAAGYNGATSVSLSDLDGDGDLDALGSAYSANNVSWWENVNGDGSVWTPYPIDTIDGPVSTFAADVDGDGDADVLGASNLAQEFSWWENTDGLGTFVENQIVIGANFDNAESVYAADLDLDGDTDVTGAAQNDNTVVWFENGDGTGQTWVTHVLSSSVPEAVAVQVADVDSDGQKDILSAANAGNLVQWWGNRGGQFSLPTEDTSPEAIPEGATVSLMTLTFTHNGRVTDSNIELAALEFLFEEVPGNTMGGPEANALIENFHVYLDDGSGVFEEDQDTVVVTVGTLVLFSGFSTISLPEDEPNVQLEAGETKTYFVVVELTPDAGSQDPNTLYLTHLTNHPSQNSSAEDVAAQIPLLMAYAPNVSSNVLTFSPELFIQKLADAAPVGTGPSAPLRAGLADVKTVAGEIPVVSPNDQIRYTIYYSNTAATNATNVLITDLMPPEAVFSDFTFTGLTPTLTIIGDEYRFDIGTVPPDSLGTITILANLASFVTEEYFFNNNATLSGYLLNTQITASSSAALEINLPAAVDAGLDQNVPVGQVYVLTAHFSDPGLKDTHEAMIDWGDGEITEGMVNEVTGTVTASHQYLIQGVYQVTVTVVDNEGASSSDFAIFTIGDAVIHLPIVLRP